MKLSDEILARSFQEGRGLTPSERGELREAYLWEQSEDKKTHSKIEKSVREFRDGKDPLNMPRHRMHGKCTSFVECPIDLKCRNYNSAYIACRNCELHETDDICMKTDLHNEQNFNMFLARERIELDGKKE